MNFSRYIFSGVYACLSSCLSSCLSRISARLKGPSPAVPKIDPNQLFLTTCAQGSTFQLKQLFFDYPDLRSRLEEGMEIAAAARNKDTVEFLLSQGARNIDMCMEIVCKLNCYDLAEFLAKKGASIPIGLRAAKSGNIIRMLYRLEQGSDMIK